MSGEKLDTGNLLKQVRENLDKLDNCPRHLFDYDELQPLGSKLVCSNCGGAMDGGKVSAYIAGYVAAGGNYRDVYPNYLKQYPMKNLHTKEE